VRKGSELEQNGFEVSQETEWNRKETNGIELKYELEF
jgi:hypothetical protein